jgi:hypothetical protein
MSQVDDGDSQWWQLNKDWMSNDKLKSTIKLPKLLIIDEATHFTSIEL